jgi:hypothetical protein
MFRRAAVAAAATAPLWRDRSSILVSRRQLLGGMIWGVSFALHEQAVMTGAPVER